MNNRGIGKVEWENKVISGRRGVGVAGGIGAIVSKKRSRSRVYKSDTGKAADSNSDVLK